MKQYPQEPVAWMLECQTMTGGTAWILSWSKSGAGLCTRMVGIEHERALYAAPRANPPPIGYWNGRETAYFEHELVYGLLPTGDCTIPIYADPPAPHRKPLTESQILELLPDTQHGWTTATYGKWVARAVERAHGINNDTTD